MCFWIRTKVLKWCLGWIASSTGLKLAQPSAAPRDNWSFEKSVACAAATRLFIFTFCAFLISRNKYLANGSCVFKQRWRNRVFKQTALHRPYESVKHSTSARSFPIQLCASFNVNLGSFTNKQKESSIKWKRARPCSPYIASSRKQPPPPPALPPQPRTENVVQK